MQEELRQGFERFAALQAAHRQALCEGRLAECLLWRGQREIAFRQLQQGLAKLGRVAGVPADELAAVQQALGLLLEGERQLAEAVRARQEQIAKQQCAMRRGKQLLGKLGAAQGGSRGTMPRVLSNRA